MLRSKIKREELDWRYGQCSIDASAERFGPFRDLVLLWQSKRRGRAFPARADFDFTDFKPWLGRIAIANLETDPFNVRFVLWGTELTVWWGADYTNKSLGELAKQPELFKEIEGKYFLTMKRDPFIGLVDGRLEQHDQPYRKVIGVDLPLGTEGNVEKVLLVHEEIDPADSLEQVLPDNPVQHYY